MWFGDSQRILIIPDYHQALVWELVPEAIVVVGVTPPLNLVSSVE